MPVRLTTPFNFTSLETLILADNPVAYYRLGETVGPNFSDELGGSDAVMINSAYTPNQPGLIAGSSDTSVDLTGGATPSYLHPPAAILDTSQDWTIEFWCELTDAGSPAAWVLYEVGLTPNAHIVSVQTNLSLIMTVSTVNVIITAPGTFPKNTISHMVFTHDNTGPGTVTAYRNGVSIGSNTTGMSNEGQIRFGHRLSTPVPTLPWVGRMDEIVLYNYPLTLPQVQAHYNAGI